jgi:hypothetical protein
MHGALFELPVWLGLGNSMSDVEVRDLSADTIGQQLGRLRCLNEFGPLAEEAVRVKFDLERDPDPIATAVFAQAMLSMRHDLRLVVDLNDEPETLRSLVRGGVVSALWRRPGISWERAPGTLGPWGRWHTWTPGARAVMAPMFAEEKESDSLFGPEHAVFINPHLTTEPFRQASVTPLIRRWLTQVVAPGLDDQEHHIYVEAPLFAIDQLVHNVREHAITPHNRSLVDSVVSVEVLTGVHGRCLRIGVLDTGAGIAATLRPKLFAEARGDGELITALLEGELPGWDRGRGLGLATIAALIADQPGASLDIWSGEARVRAEATVVEQLAPEVTGTVVNAFFPLPAN